MKTSAFLLMLLFSLSCYSQKNIDISFSISKEKETLFIHIENKSDSVMLIKNGHIIHRIEEYEGSRVYISDQRKERYRRDEMFVPINSYNKGEKWYNKKFYSEVINPRQKKVMEITGIAEGNWVGIKDGFLDKDSLYVKLDLHVDYNPKESDETTIIVFEQWVPVE